MNFKTISVASDVVLSQATQATQATALCPKKFTGTMRSDLGPYNQTDLYWAVRKYVEQDCWTDDQCEIGREYGHPMNSWCVGDVTDFNDLFALLAYGRSGGSFFNEDISSWDVSKVTSLDATFNEAKRFNQDINSWDVSRVTSLEWTFKDAVAFNQPIGSWNVSGVTSLEHTFWGARSFNQPIGSWNVSSVTSLESTFWDAWTFNQPIGSWNVSRVISMLGALYNSSFNQDLCAWGSSYRSGGDYSLMFLRTNCPNQTEPTSPEGPWCHSCSSAGPSKSSWSAAGGLAIVGAVAITISFMG